jgi:hypothetical protein
VRHPGALTVASAQYRLIAADGTELEAGGGDVASAGGVLELQPADGATLRVQAAAIASIGEPEPYTVLVTLADGSALELSRLGRMRTQLLAELRDARAEVAAERSGAVGDSARFTATIAGSPVDLHIFEDALLVIADGSARRIAFSFVNDVRARDYTVTIDAASQDTITVTRLGRRTDEFTALLAERLRSARTRTSAFLGSLLPGLEPMALRAAAALLRDGVAAPARGLDAIHPGLSAALLRVAALPDRWTAVSAIADRTDLAIGFRQLASVRRSAVGLTPWRDPSATPHIGQHESPGGRFGSGLGGVITAGLASGLGPGGYGPGGYGGGWGGPFGGGPGGYGELGAYWAFGALGAGRNGNSAARPVTPSADVQLAPLIPATDDVTALTVSGAEPTVLAFALLSPARGGDLVVYEALNLPEPQTYVYRTVGADPRARVNQALDDVGFAAAEIGAVATDDLTAVRRQDAVDGPGSPLVRGLVATVPHTPDWAREVAARLDGQ